MYFILLGTVFIFSWSSYFTISHICIMYLYYRNIIVVIQNCIDLKIKFNNFLYTELWLFHIIICIFSPDKSLQVYIGTSNVWFIILMVYAVNAAYYLFTIVQTWVAKTGYQHVSSSHHNGRLWRHWNLPGLATVFSLNKVPAQNDCSYCPVGSDSKRL